MLPPLTLHRHPHDITAVDVEYQYHGHCASHIVVQDGRALIVDVGPNDGVPRVLAGLRELGLGPEAVDYVFLTHVHLDHAGGAGVLLRELPNARALLHPRGAPHMIDPAKLVAASIAVYGEALYRELYGDIAPIEAARVHATCDGERLSLAGRVLECWFTPGHAMHHQAIVDQGSRTIFTGDTFGLSYREFDTSRGAFIFPTTTPTQFDPEQLEASVARIAAYRPRAVHLTHYARVDDIERLAADMTAQVRAFAAMALRHVAAADRRARIHADMRALLRERSLAHGCTMDDAQFDVLVAADLELNTDGLLAWLERRGRA